MGKLLIEVSGVTDVGIQKDVNQDSFVYKVVDSEDGHAGVFAVADGVGGLESGEIASAITINNIKKWWEEQFLKSDGNKEEIVKTLIEVLDKINNQILVYSQINHKKMATTLSLVLIFQNEFIIFNVGDSRVYRYSGTFNVKLEQLTVDHSCIIEKEVNGKLIRKSALTQSLGAKSAFRYYSNIGSIKKGDIFFVCSDGIYKTLSDSEIKTIIKQNKNDLDAITHKLVTRVKEKGETDNITIIAFKIKGE